MNHAPLASSSSVRLRVIGLCWALSLVALAVALGCLKQLLSFTSAQWSFFVLAMSAYAALAAPPLLMAQRRALAPIGRWLDASRAGSAADAELRNAFSALMDLPRRLALAAGLVWVLPGPVVGVCLWWRFDQWGAYQTGVVTLTGVAVGVVVGSFCVLLLKRLLEPVREALAAELRDPAERASLIRRLSLRTKLLASIGGVTVVPVLFGIALCHAKATRSLEDFALSWQHRVLKSVEARGSDETLDAAIRRVLGGEAAQPAPLQVRALGIQDAAAPELLGPEVLAHLREQLDSGVRQGDSARLPTRDVFAWRIVGDGQLLVAVTPRDALGFQAGDVWAAFSTLLLVSIVVAFSLAVLLSQDIGGSARVLRSEVERLTSGDLRGRRGFESEDELGEVWRSFQRMSGWLRGTIERVTAAADRVESATTEMNTAAESVSQATADQLLGITQTSQSMEALNGQVRGIADSAQSLSVSVEESSSSILELGAAGEQLNETASVLSTKVDEVSTSLEEMVQSVKSVSQNTEALGEAAIETSASMEEMASSLRAVDTSAGETARLSDQVVSVAESGRDKVRQTIQGMEAIRDATDTAESVIRSLASRTNEIGAIVDVIDDVADETNLLALNAAIIAAQAGEHGRAFSVVADEIKDLADRVLASTKEIGSLIRAVQDEATNATGAIETGARSVLQGVDLSAEAGVALEEITRSSRDSGGRIAEIVAAVREQAKGAGRVVDLMERVRGEVEQIRNAASEQDRGNELLFRSSSAMRDMAQQVQGTTEEHARGSRRIRESVEEVRDTVERINGALQEQSAACRSAVEFLSAVLERTRSNEQSVRSMGHSTKMLRREVTSLREELGRFRL